MASLSTTPFLFHTTEEQYLVGVHDVPATLRVKIYSYRYILLLAYCVIAVGLVGISYGIYQYTSGVSAVNGHAMSVRGWVTNRTLDEAAQTYAVAYRYTLDGQLYTNTLEVEREMGGRYLPGAAITVWTHPSKPEISGLTAEALPTPVPVIGLLGGLLAMFGGLLAYGVLSYRGQYHRLFRTRQIVTGEIIALHERYAHTDYYEIEIHTLFTAPNTGQPIRGTRRYRVDVSKAAMIPTIGTPLRILYLNPRIWEIL